MELIPPPFQLGQGFGENADPLYAALKLKGHPGIDYGTANDWGKPIPYAINGAIISAILGKDNIDLEVFRAVNYIYEDTDGSCYEIQDGHCSTITAKVGDITDINKSGACLGNTGDVYGGNPFHYITDAEKKTGSTAGSHVHFQVRAIKKVLANDSVYAHYLNDGTGRLIINGYAYAVPNWDNGFNGCISPAQFFSPIVIPQSDTDSLNVIKAETQVLNTTTDTSVRAAFIKDIIARVKAFFGY